MYSEFRPPSSRRGMSSQRMSPRSQSQNSPLTALPRSARSPLPSVRQQRQSVPSQRVDRLPSRHSSQRREVRSTVRQFPQLQQYPQWLQSLIKVQRGSLLVTLGLGLTVLALYSWTFYSQHLWGKEYYKLEELRRNERQMSAYTGVIKDEITNQALKSQGTLIPKSPNTLIFIPSAPANRTNPVPRSPKPGIKSIPPVGY
jgi:Coiled-coil domain-containing protein 56